MKKGILYAYLNELVCITFNNGSILIGELKFKNVPGVRCGWNHPGYFQIGDEKFYASDVRSMRRC